MYDDLIRWVVRAIPSRHLSNYLTNHYRKNLIPAWQWVDCFFEGQIFRLKVNTGEVHGYLCYMYGEIEPELTFFIRHLVSSKRFFLDIGANVGYYSLLAGMVNRNCQIYSFEPSPQTFKILCENVNANHFLNIQTQQLALSDKTGILRFNIYPDQAFNSPNTGNDDQHYFFKEDHTQVIDVSATKLDDFLAEHHLPQPDIIKLDVEGFEYFVLQGAKNLLTSANPPILLCEVEPVWLKRFKLVPSDLIEYLERLGYQAFTLTHYGLIPKNEINHYPPSCDMVFVQTNDLKEILDINRKFYSGSRKFKGEIKKVLLSLWKRLKS